jgi:hypothetical protein
MFKRGLLTVMLGAQTLQCSFPEKLFIAFVRDDMISMHGRRNHVLLGAYPTEGLDA